MALEWLKGILGEGYTETIDAAISAEIGKSFVPKADFNTKNEALKELTKQLKERDSQLETLKGTVGNTEELKDQIAKLQEDNAKNKANYETKLNAIMIENAAVAELTAAGAKNIVAAKALLADFLDGAKITEDGAVKKVNKDGTVKTLTEAVQGLVQGEGTAFIFAQNSSPLQLSGMLPGDPGGRAPAPSTASSEADYKARLEAARKSGDTVAAIAVKTEAAKQGITLF